VEYTGQETSIEHEVSPPVDEAPVSQNIGDKHERVTAMVMEGDVRAIRGQGWSMRKWKRQAHGWEGQGKQNQPQLGHKKRGRI
jgi:hypothetical protein